jgi:hypothetical protein
MYRIEIGFGIGEDKNGNPVMYWQSSIASVLADIAKMHGGYFLRGGNGGWVNPAGALVTEPGMVLRIDGVDGFDAFKTAQDAAERWGNAIRDALNQAAVVRTIIKLASCEVV